MVKIAPSILSADFSKLAKEIETVKDADHLHIDVMDGHFVPNLTIGPLVVEAIREKTDQVFEVHLAVEDCNKYIPDFIAAGADIIVIHAEACVHLSRTVRKIKSQGAKAGVALNPATSISPVIYLLEEIDMVSVMGVDPGFGGQTFVSSVLSKVKKLRKLINKKELKISIQVDGGVKPHTTAVEVVKAGADILAVGSAVFEVENRGEVIKLLKES